MIYVIGMGMGAKGLRTLAAQEALEQVDLIIGAKRLLEDLEDELCPRRIAEYRSDAIVELLQKEKFEKAAILLSGDLSFYSGARKLREDILETRIQIKHPMEIIPGISSLSYMCMLLNLPMQDVAIYSAHGQDCDVVSAVMQGKVSFFLTGGENTTSKLCQDLCDAGLGDLIVAVGEDLSYDDMMVRTMRAREAAGREGADLAVLVVWPAPSAKRGMPGIPDEAFIRGEVPMTKRMVRLSAVCLLNPTPEDVCWDVGAGTGSVSIELAQQSKRVYAIERKQEAVELIAQNRSKFHAYNLHIVEGEAPQALEDLEAPQVVFIGGSSGRIEDILALLPQQQVRVCVTAVTLETLEGARSALEQAGFAPQVTQLSVTETRNVGNYHMLDGQNPVFIIYGER